MGRNSARRRESDISRVLFSTAAVLLGGRLSIWDACYQTPQAVLLYGTGKRPTVVPLTLLPTGVYRASTSRYCWCALTTPLHPYLWAINFWLTAPSAVCFCGTILTVTRTGRYPASLAFREPGLSSDSLLSAKPQPPVPTLSLIQSSRPLPLTVSYWLPVKSFFSEVIPSCSS